MEPKRGKHNTRNLVETMTVMTLSAAALAACTGGHVATGDHQANKTQTGPDTKSEKVYPGPRYSVYDALSHLSNGKVVTTGFRARNDLPWHELMNSNEQVVTSCEGATVNVDVELRRNNAAQYYKAMKLLDDQSNVERNFAFTVPEKVCADNVLSRGEVEMVNFAVVDLMRSTFQEVDHLKQPNVYSRP